MSNSVPSTSQTRAAKTSTDKTRTDQSGGNQPNIAQVNNSQSDVNTDANQPHTNSVTSTWLDSVAFNADGLIPAIAQDSATGDILMMAWMNKQALVQTVQTRTAVYFSRSRGQLWHKGETSGHTQHVHDIFLDCDADAIILKVMQVGGIACHTGRRSCFYQKLDVSGAEPAWQNAAPVLKNPDDIYGAPTHNSVSKPNGDVQHNSAALTSSSVVTAHSVLSQLDTILVERKQADAGSSYVASLYAKGINKILEKVGEEAVEAVIAAKDLAASSSVNDSAGQLSNAPVSESTAYPAALVNDLVYEIADIWFHTLVTLAWFNIKSDDVLIELARRFGLSGIDEKNSRTDS